MSFDYITTWRNWKHAFEPACLAELEQMEANGIKPAAFIAERKLPHLSAQLHESLKNQSSYLAEKSDLKEFLLAKIWCNDPTVNCMIGGLKNKNILTEKTKYFGLSILSLSIILKCDETARTILNNIGDKSEINTKDKAGWTALHHAYVCSPKDIRKLLKLKGAFNTLSNSFDAKPSTLKKMTTLTKKDLKISLLFRRRTEVNDKKISAHEIIESAHASESIVIPDCIIKTSKIAPSVLYDIWKMNNEGYKTINQCHWTCEMGINQFDYSPKFLLGLAHLYNSNHWDTFNPQVALRIVDRDDQGNILKKKIGYGLFAAEPLNSDTKVERYAGRIEELNDDNIYSLVISKKFGMPVEKYKINANQLRSLGAYANHGFPNAVFMEGPDGTTWISTIDCVAQNEQIIVSYGPKYFKKSRSLVELRPKALEEFGKTHSLEAAYQTFISKQPLKDLIHWSYIFIDTPVSFLRLILKGVYSKEQVASFSERIKKSGTLKSFFENLPKDVLEFCFNLVENNKSQADALADHLHSFCYPDKTAIEHELNEMEEEVAKEA